MCRIRAEHLQILFFATRCLLLQFSNNTFKKSIMPGKTKWKLTAPSIFLVFAFLSLPSMANSQNTASSKSGDTLNIGFVLYTKSNTPGTLYARWNYANTWSGPGIATGGPKEGFAGRYHVRYFYENGEFSDEYDLLIEKTGDFYSVSWTSNGKVLAKGIGMKRKTAWRLVGEE